MVTDQITIKEFRDPFKGQQENNAKAVKQRPLKWWLVRSPYRANENPPAMAEDNYN